MQTAILLSGGVDSSLALYKAIEEGYKDIKAFYLKIWLEDELSYIGDCPWQEDLNYVKEVCSLLNVEFEIINLQEEYYERVVEYAIAELKNGGTPSPDIFCNQRIKFGAFLEKISNNFKTIITGHYAIIDKINGKTFLKEAKDREKDQTYFLSHLFKSQLEKLYFPIGNMLKSEVREIARELNLPNKDRKDSQGICFLGKIKYNDFVKHYLGEKKGAIVEYESGKELGEHNGYWFYTIGQRKGLHLGNGPWFVVKKDIKKNIIYISHYENLLMQKKREIRVNEIHWINSRARDGEEVYVKLRHGPQKTKAIIHYENNDSLKINLEEGDSGISAGQFAVFYKDNICLGAAKICYAI